MGTHPTEIVNPTQHKRMLDVCTVLGDHLQGVTQDEAYAFRPILIPVPAGYCAGMKAVELTCEQAHVVNVDVALASASANECETTLGYILAAFNAGRDYGVDIMLDDDHLGVSEPTDFAGMLSGSMRDVVTEGYTLPQTVSDSRARLSAAFESAKRAIARSHGLGDTIDTEAMETALRSVHTPGVSSDFAGMLRNASLHAAPFPSAEPDAYSDLDRKIAAAYGMPVEQVAAEAVAAVYGDPQGREAEQALAERLLSRTETYTTAETLTTREVTLVRTDASPVLNSHRKGVLFGDPVAKAFQDRATGARLAGEALDANPDAEFCDTVLRNGQVLRTNRQGESRIIPGDAA